MKKKRQEKGPVKRPRCIGAVRSQTQNIINQSKAGNEKRRNALVSKACSIL
jgi:hypothetical protein